MWYKSNKTLLACAVIYFFQIIFFALIRLIHTHVIDYNATAYNSMRLRDL